MTNSSNVGFNGSFVMESAFMLDAKSGDRYLERFSEESVMPAARAPGRDEKFSPKGWDSSAKGNALETGHIERSQP